MTIPSFKLERYFARYEFNTEYLLCSSDCESVTIADLLALEPEASQKFQLLWLGYTESQGSPTLRKAICDLYENINPEEVLVHTGAEEAIYLFMNAMLERGDHVVVHWPCYQSLVELPRAVGCDISLWKAQEKNNWALDLDQLQSLLKPNTKAILINTPHNPTGYLMSRTDFKAVSDLAAERGLILFSDEVYRESEYEPDSRLPGACDLGEHAVSLGVMSKTYGLAGLRIGWIATKNRKVYQKIAALKDYTTICTSAPSEFLAELALHHRNDLRKRNMEIIRNNLAIMDDFFLRQKDLFTWVKPRAGSMAFPHYRGGDIESFCDKLVREAGVLLLPGSVYDDPDNHFRLGLGRKNLPEAVKQFVGFLKRN